MASPCCPPGAHGLLAEPADYAPKGELRDASGMQCYVVGSGSKGILVGHDAFGLRSGRTKQICDELAASLGVLVVAPNLWSVGDTVGGPSGEVLSNILDRVQKKQVRWWQWPGLILRALWHFPSVKRSIQAHTWGVVGPRVNDKVLPLMRSKGAAEFACVGFCWGGWLATKAAALPDFRCCVTFHPSQSQICKLLGEDFRAECEQVRCPQMILAAKDDKDDVKEGGLAQQVFQTKLFGAHCVFKTFGEMQHGWVARGDLGDAKIARDYAEAMGLAKEFLRSQLLSPKQ